MQILKALSVFFHLLAQVWQEIISNIFIPKENLKNSQAGPDPALSGQGYACCSYPNLGLKTYFGISCGAL